MTTPTRDYPTLRLAIMISSHDNLQYRCHSNLVLESMLNRRSYWELRFSLPIRFRVRIPEFLTEYVSMYRWIWDRTYNTLLSDSMMAKFTRSFNTAKLIMNYPWQQGSQDQHGAHLGPIGPRWAPCWPHDLCCLGCLNTRKQPKCNIETYLITLVWY